MDDLQRSLPTPATLKSVICHHRMFHHRIVTTAASVISMILTISEYFFHYFLRYPYIRLTLGDNGELKLRKVS